jgi:hypothetical protein
MSLALGIFLLFMQLLKQGYLLHGVTRQLVQANIKANRSLYSLKRAAHLAGFNLSKAVAEHPFIGAADNDSDILSISYQPDVDTIGVKDCLGVKRTQTQTLHYYIRSSAISSFGTWDFMCKGQARADSLENHIAYLQVLYFVDLGQIDDTGLLIAEYDGVPDVLLAQNQLQDNMQVVGISYALLTVLDKMLGIPITLPPLTDLYEAEYTLKIEDNLMPYYMVKNSEILFNNLYAQ